MKIVELTNGKVGIPIITKTYITKERLISILSNLVFYEKIDLENTSKSEVIKEVRLHVWFQGITVHANWYEDTDDTPVINAICVECERFVEIAFPELK